MVMNKKCVIDTVTERDIQTLLKVYSFISQLLRQLLDDKVLCTLQKPFEWKTIEGLTVISAMSMSEHPSVNNQILTERLLVN